MKRFFTPKEQQEIGDMASDDYPDLDSLIPFDSIRISQNSYEMAKLLGPMIEEETQWPFEFYSEGLEILGEDIIRVVNFPVQERVSAVSFEPTQAMLIEMNQTLRYLKEQTEKKWISSTTIHGHGRGSGSNYIDFSPMDRDGNMAQFLEAMSPPTWEVIDDPTLMSLAKNDYDISRKKGHVVVSDDWVFHPELWIDALDDPSSQEAFYEWLGKTKEEIGGRTPADILEAYLHIAAQKGTEFGHYAVSARQYRFRRHAKFLVFDNAGNEHGEIGIIVEDTVTGHKKPHYKSVPIEPVEVDNDLKITEEELRQIVRNNFAKIIDQRRESIYVPGQHTTQEDLLPLIDARSWKPEELPTHITLPKQTTPEIGDYDIATLFYYSVQKYLAMAHKTDYCYSTLLSGLLEFTSSDQTRNLTFSYIVATYKGDEEKPIKDLDHAFVIPHFDHFTIPIVTKLANSLTVSRGNKLERTFMYEFSKAPGVEEQNSVIEKYIPELYKAGGLGPSRGDL